jgi:hypothetical protein
VLLSKEKNVSCHAGGDDDEQTPSVQENQNNPPNVDAGQDQELTEGGGVVALDGSGSTHRY